ncbi:hypothetical protein VTL71DRAFT_1751 [Oculimacula yallundae]|uniref:Maturase K n=1 Tax=Oculimacula yallundae TaxID=86028 RepID=A0ABR4CBK6_9HELO
MDVYRRPEDKGYHSHLINLRHLPQSPSPSLNLLHLKVSRTPKIYIDFLSNIGSIRKLAQVLFNLDRLALSPSPPTF